MKLFAELFLDLDRTNKTNAKIDLLKNYFKQAGEADKIWALALFSGRRPSFKVSSTQVRTWACEEAGIPEWLFNECYNSVGDLGEMISLVLPQAETVFSEKTLAEWFDYLNRLPALNDEEKREYITGAWKQLGRHEKFVFNKLLMGSFRIGVSQTLVVRALSELYEIHANVVALRLISSCSVKIKMMMHQSLTLFTWLMPWKAMCHHWAMKKTGSWNGNGMASARRSFIVMENYLYGRGAKTWPLINFPSCIS